MSNSYSCHAVAYNQNNSSTKYDYEHEHESYRFALVATIASGQYMSRLLP